MLLRRSIVLAIMLATACNVHPGDRDGGASDGGTSDTAVHGDACHVCVDASRDTDASDASVPVTAPVLYPTGRRHSPITASVAARLATIAHAASTANVFAKVGDSITEMSSFATCFDSSYQLASHASLEPTRAYFAGGNAAGTSPYSRTSLAATGGWQTSDEIAGMPCPLSKEETAIAPLYGVVLLGTNDNRYGRSPIAYGHDLWTIVDDLIARGTVPILSTIPPVNGDTSTDARVPLFNLIVRAIAQGRQIPLIDFHDELTPLPNRGISSDGLHPTVSPSGACDLSDSGLQYGFNVRNLITLEALDRARGAVAGSAPDATAATRVGAGSHASPFLGSIPLVDVADTHDGEATFAQYTCDSTARNGHEIVYKLNLAARATIDAYLIEHGATDASVYVLAGSLATSACVASGGTTLTATVGPGVVYVVVDSTTTASEGEYALVIDTE